MNQHTHDKNHADTDAIEAALMATREDPDQAALDRLMRHTRHTAAQPAKRGFNWGWMVMPMAAAGAAAALVVANQGGSPEVEGLGGPVAVVVTPDDEALETEIATVLDETLESSESSDLGAFETLASYAPTTTSEDWGALDLDDDADAEDADAWIDAYEAVLAEG